MANTIESDRQWMERCFQLAKRGIGHVSPNPAVGAVLVYQNRILGEGCHTHFGGPHAEVEAFRNVIAEERHLIPEATLYVSLEPCCTTGKTPPCTDLILKEKLMDVRIGTYDPNPDVAGKSVQLLTSRGVKITTGILEKEALELIRPFSTNILQLRPYVILKWAQSSNGFFGKEDEKIWLSHHHTNIWTHKMRSEVDGIMVGSRTVRLDDPLLTTRDNKGRSPKRIIYDPNGKLDAHFRVFNDDGIRIFYFSRKENDLLKGDHIIQYILTPEKDELNQILSLLYNLEVGILLVEGGAFVHNIFIEHGLWDEACVIQTKHPLNVGVLAPNLKGKLLDKITIGPDTILSILNQK